MRLVRLAFSVGAAAVLGASAAPFDSSLPLPSDPGAYNDTTGEGQALVQDLLSRVPVEDSEILGLLKIRPPEGGIVEVPVKMTIRVGAHSWNDVYETQPASGRPGEILVIQHQPGEPNRYLAGRFQDRSQPPKLQPLASTNLFQPFAGSDFYPADLGLEFLHWPAQKIVKKEMRKSRSCRVVESLNPNPLPGTYSRVLSWLDFETGNIIMAEGYDLRNQLLKAFSVRSISRHEGKAQVKEIEIRNDQTDSRTRLEFNYEVEDK